MNADYHVPVNFQVYRLDIEESNNRDSIAMEMWFDFKREFELENLSPKSHLKLSEELLIDNEKAALYR